MQLAPLRAGRATCGTFHSDQMLWATKETAHLVLVRLSLSLCTLSDGF
jgi:hypothetical protein